MTDAPKDRELPLFAKYYVEQRIMNATLFGIIVGALEQAGILTFEEFADRVETAAGHESEESVKKALTGLAETLRQACQNVAQPNKETPQA